MQNTRLNTLVQSVTEQVTQVFRTPWQQTSLLLLSLLSGFFIGNAISTTAGQRGFWDVSVAFLLLLSTELISRVVYRRAVRSLWLNAINSFKLGVIYSLFLDAFKLGS